MTTTRNLLINLGADSLANALLELAEYSDEAAELDSLAVAINDWQRFADHQLYKKQLRGRHGRKYGFWGKYDAERGG